MGPNTIQLLTRHEIEWLAGGCPHPPGYTECAAAGDSRPPRSCQEVYEWGNCRIVIDRIMRFIL